MTETEIAVKIAEMGKEVGSLKHRVDDLEMESKDNQRLLVSVNKMAVNMEHMLEEQQKQGRRLEALEKVPTETNKQVKSAILTALIGSTVGAVITAIITLL